ncbi:MAG: 2-dehydropantoate 2-reductase [Idiomarina sp.]|nr:2-dehydropantoate 2-reductase [Idiomarina sp.]
MTWVVVGTGALGSLIASRLHAQGEAVYLLTRYAEDAPALTLQVQGHTEALMTLPVLTHAMDAPNHARWILPVKAWQLDKVLTTCAPALHEHSEVIVSHNGMGAGENFFASRPKLTVYDWVTTHGAWRESRCVTTHAGQGQSWLGARPSDSSQSNASPPDWLSVWQKALPPLIWEENILERRWLKLAVNCVINPLATLADDVNGVLRQPSFQADILGLCQELSQVMSAAIAKEVTAHSLHSLVLGVIEATATNHNSMLQDERAGRPTEIDYLNGYIHKKGQTLNLPTPLNTALYERLSS